jgi:hypothetical protein
MHNPETLSHLQKEEDSYEQALKKRAFLDSISDKYSRHTRLLTDTRYFNYMLRQIDRCSDYYALMLKDMNNPDFDFEIHEKKFDAIIEEDKSIIAHLGK